MSNNTANAGTDTQNEEGAERTFTQEEVNKLVGAARTKEREKYSDYEEIKKNSEAYLEMVEKDKTDLERANDRATKAEQELELLKAERDRAAWVREVSEESGVPAEALRGSTKEELEAHAEALEPYFEKKQGAYVQSDGRRASAGATRSTADMFATALNDII